MEGGAQLLGVQPLTFLDFIKKLFTAVLTEKHSVSVVGSLELATSFSIVKASI